MKPTFTLSPKIGDSLTPSPTLYINERVKALWAAGETVYHLGFGESRFPVHPKIEKALAENAHHSSYLPGPGIPQLRAAAAAYYAQRMGIEVTAQQVMVGPGSKSLLYALFTALDGDLILPTPSWVSYEPQAKLRNRPVLRIPADPADFHSLHVDALRETLAQSEADQHVLMLNSPNNPTGQMLPAELLAEIADVCRATNTLVFSDELYGFIPHRDAHRSMAEFYPEGTVVLSGLSKHLSVGGWRLGVALFPPGEDGVRLLAAVNKVGSEIWSCAPAPVQYAALTAYSGDPEIEAYIAECTHLHAVRTHYLWEGLNELDIPSAEPQGGFYVFPNFDGRRAALAAKGITTSAELARHLLDEWQIASLPGSVFGAPPEELSLRLSASYVDMETDDKARHVLDVHRSGVDDDTLLREHHPMMNQSLNQFHQFLDSLMD
ncbi:MAG: aminotransferase class I/II-fold pyridoxal phosphate-dependent enzyme [Caldilineaceae bacterium]|nr:aminotransferase class I/II-fold pyridoxal phosphate-dependent enzyme [Caldilineaceae bacterium]